MLQGSKETCSHYFFHSCTVHLDIMRLFYLPTDAEEKFFKKGIKIYNKTAVTCFGLTLIRLTWRIWRVPNNASKWQMGFNSAFKGLITITWERINRAC